MSTSGIALRRLYGSACQPSSRRRIEGFDTTGSTVTDCPAAAGRGTSQCTIHTSQFTNCPASSRWRHFWPWSWLPRGAHHGDADRYNQEVVTVTGTVADVQMVNPHARIILDVEEGGKTVLWQAELGGPQQLIKQFGWTPATIKKGMKLTMIGRRLKSGAPYLNLTERANIVVADTGKEIYRTDELRRAGAHRARRARWRSDADRDRSWPAPGGRRPAAAVAAAVRSAVRPGGASQITQTGLSQGLEHRGVRPLRLRRRDPGPHRAGRRHQRRRHHDGRGRAARGRRLGRRQRQPARQLACSTPAPSTSSRAAGERLDAAGLPQGVEPARQRRVRPRRGAQRRRQHAGGVGVTGSRATPRASTATRRTSRFRRPAPSTCSRGAAPPGRNRPTSRRRTPARPARPTPSAKAISSRSRWRSAPTATRWPWAR